MVQSGKRFSVFHMSFAEIDQGDLFAPRLSRSEWVYRCFSEPFEAPYRGGDRLVWTPRKPIDGVIFGIVQREILSRRHLAPEEGGAETVAPDWQGAYILIDANDHKFGQRIAIEHDVVGRPSTLANYIAKYLNEKDERPFDCSVEQIFSASDFWEFAHAAGNQLKFMRFTFIAPNMWKTREGLEEDLRRARNATRAIKYGMSLAGANGVTSDNDFVKGAIDYVAQGGGRVRARDHRGNPFDSADKTLRTEVDNEIVVELGTEEAIRRSAPRVLGHEV